jgi:DNA polymerase-1
MGIIATDPTRTDERIIVSADKDMQTIPGKLYRPQDQYGDKPRIQEISLEEADRFHLWQTIVGDATDGYPGLPGAGPVEAEKLLSGHAWASYVRQRSRGPRKGEPVVEWKLEEALEYTGWVYGAWQRLLSGYHRRGLTEADAIKQARLARILRYDEWDGRSPKLWNPPTA